MSHPDDASNLQPPAFDGDDRGKPLTHGDDAGIQSPTTTGGDDSDERPISPSEGPVTDAERLQAENGSQ